MFKKLFALMPLILDSLTTETAKKAIDAMLDVVEDAIEESEAKWDDRFLLPAIKIARRLTNIPDND